MSSTARLKVNLPWPPSVNHYWASRGNRRYLSPKAQAWLQEATLLIRQTRISFSGSVRVHITAHPPDNRKRDLDNLLKAVLDALAKAGAIQDDSLVVELCVARASRIPGGVVNVAVEELT